MPHRITGAWREPLGSGYVLYEPKGIAPLVGSEQALYHSQLRKEWPAFSTRPGVLSEPGRAAEVEIVGRGLRPESSSVAAPRRALLLGSDSAQRPARHEARPIRCGENAGDEDQSDTGSDPFRKSRSAFHDAPFDPSGHVPRTVRRSLRLVEFD